MAADPVPHPSTAPAAAADVFYVRSGPRAPLVLSWPRDRPFTIGRLPENALALLDDENVSRRHAEVRYVDGAAVIHDPGSANGTLLNDRPVEGPTPLRPGDRIQVADHEIVFNPPPGPAPGRAQLRSVAAGSDWAAPLPSDRTAVLGSDPASTLPLPHSSVGAEHATIQPLFGDYVLTDLDSGQPTLVNGALVGGSTRLRAGDSVQIGAYEFRFECDAPAATGGRQVSAAAALAAIAPFGELAPPLVEALAAQMSWVTLEAGAPLTTAEDTEAALYVLVDGQARIEGSLGESQPQPYTLAALGPGDWVGERALVEDAPFPRRLVAVTQLQALKLTRAAYLAHLAGDARLRAFIEQRLLPFAVRRALGRTLVCRTLPPAVVDALAARLRPVQFAPNEPLASRGAPCTRLLLLVGGWARVLLPRGKSEQVVGRLGAGEYLGDAISRDDGTDPYTLVAETPVRALELSAADLRAVVGEHPGVRALLADPWELVPPSVLLQSVAPFNSLPPQLVSQTAAAMRRKTFRAGEIIVEQDDPASAFYIVVRGSVQVSFRTSEGEERPITTLGTGQHFGEAALLTGEARNATVRAAEDCQLWALYRHDFAQALQAGRAFELGAYFTQSLTMRSRPRHKPNVEIAEQHDADEIAYMLRSPIGDNYLRLSERGMFVWNLLDGDHTINDICVAWFARYNNFGVEVIGSTVAQLQALGFVEVPPTDLQELQPAVRPTPLQRVIAPILRVSSWRKVLPHTDEWFTALYRRVGWLFFTPPALLLLALLTLAGIGAFAFIILYAIPSKEDFNLLAFLFVVPGLVGITMVHELGHALTVKHFRRRVTGAGFGVYYFFPYAFVGTSDIWMTGRWPRIAVSAAGPLVNLFTGALFSLLALLIPVEWVRSVLFVLAGMSFLLVIGNLHPFMELDGYYVLVDWLGVPSLRKRSMRFLRNGLWRCLRRGRFTREERALAIFGVTAALFTAFMGFSITFGAQGFYASIAEGLFPGGPSMLIAQIVSALGLLVFLVPFAVELELITPQGLADTSATTSGP